MVLHHDHIIVKQALVISSSIVPLAEKQGKAESPEIPMQGLVCGEYAQVTFVILSAKSTAAGLGAGSETSARATAVP